MQSNDNKRAAPTVDSLRTGLANIDKSLSLLTREINGVSAKLGRFKGVGRRNQWGHVPEENLGDAPEWAARISTEEPKTHIMDSFDAEAESHDSVQATSIVLRAIGRDIDGALRDIRAMRNDVEAIKDDSDLRNDFKDWLINNR